MVNEEFLYSKILTFLSLKDRTEYEIRQRAVRYLQKSPLSRDEKQGLIEKIVKELYALKLLDDSAYASKFVSQKIAGTKPESKYTIRQFLVKKGVAKQIIDSALTEYVSDMEFEKALEAAKNKLSTMRETDKYKRKVKLFRYLNSKRFPSHVIYSVIDTITELK